MSDFSDFLEELVGLARAVAKRAIQAFLVLAVGLIVAAAVGYFLLRQTPFQIPGILILMLVSLVVLIPIVAMLAIISRMPGARGVMGSVRRVVVLVMVVSLLAIVGVVIAAQLPSVRPALQAGVDNVDRQISGLARVDPLEFESVEALDAYDFWHPETGEPRVWYYVDDEGNYVLYERDRHVAPGIELRPVQTVEQHNGIRRWQVDQDEQRRLERERQQRMAAEQRAQRERTIATVQQRQAERQTQALQQQQQRTEQRLAQGRARVLMLGIRDRSAHGGGDAHSLATDVARLAHQQMEDRLRQASGVELIGRSRASSEVQALGWSGGAVSDTQLAQLALALDVDHVITGTLHSLSSQRRQSSAHGVRSDHMQLRARLQVRADNLVEHLPPVVETLDVSAAAATRRFLQMLDTARAEAVVEALLEDTTGFEQFMAALTATPSDSH